MSDDTDANAMLRSGYDRWLRLETGKEDISGDLRELFVELKGNGFDAKALRASFRAVRDLNDPEKQSAADEHDALVALYVSSLTGARPARAHEKTLKNLPPAETVTATEAEGELVTPSGSRLTSGTNPGGEDADGAGESGAPDQGSAAAHHGVQSEVVTPSSDESVTSREASPVALPATFTFKPFALRPHCQHPEVCSGQGREHCFACRQLMEGQAA